jgi:DNA-binding Lrp family transcriptional regulator
MSNDDIDRQITDHLARLIRKDEAPESIGEIADQLGLGVTRVRSSINRLVSFGEVREAGSTYSGAKTWTLSSDTR